MRKLAQTRHHLPCVTVQRRDGKVKVCPHCQCEVKEKDIYRDSKNWAFHRPCFIKGKGSIALDKEGADAPVIHERQTNDYNCGPAALKAVENTMGVGPSDQKSYQVESGADSDKGTPIPNLEQTASGHGLQVNSQGQMDLNQLQQSVQAGKPVIVAVQLDGEGGGPDSGWEAGHYVVVTGIDNGQVTFMDPSSESPERSWPIEEFVKRWHDHDHKGQIYNQWGMTLHHPAEAKEADFRDREYEWMSQELSKRMLSGRHGIDRQPVTKQQLLKVLPREQGEQVSFHSFRGEGSPFQKATGAPGTAMFVSGLPEAAMDYMTPGGMHNYLSQLSTPVLRQFGQSGPFTRHAAIDTRGFLGGLKGRFIKRFPGFITWRGGGRTFSHPQYEAVVTQPADLRSATQQAFKILPSGEYMRVVSPGAMLKRAVEEFECKQAYSGSLGSGATSGQATDPPRLVDASGTTPAGQENQPASDAIKCDSTHLDKCEQDPDPLVFDTVALEKAAISPFDLMSVGTEETQEAADDTGAQWTGNHRHDSSVELPWKDRLRMMAQSYPGYQDSGAGEAAGRMFRASSPALQSGQSAQNSGATSAPEVEEPVMQLDSDTASIGQPQHLSA